ncbi:hypothetical protein R3P38DRAFT_1871354 [Favolaschia claudopus]|uniref:Uncharacterized protein n=1 Tax=Favolaschia claudopus TaxID=2862362 RepID=A0AAW0D7R4_9AGAR
MLAHGSSVLSKARKFFTRFFSVFAVSLRRAQTSSSHPQSESPVEDTRHQTASNALYLSLRTLSTVSNGVPGGESLNAILDPLLDLTDCVEPTPSNACALAQLAARIERLTPVIQNLAKDNSDQGRIFLESLEKVLDSMKKELEKAAAEDELNQFFNADYNNVILERYNMGLARLIADSTLVAVHEVLTSLRELERSKTADPASSEVRPPLVYHLTGGFGTMAGSGTPVGGEGGAGEGPQLSLEPDGMSGYSVSGGTGGHGGAGTEVGGKGGTGNAPVIIMRRRFMTPPI